MTHHVHSKLNYGIIHSFRMINMSSSLFLLRVVILLFGGFRGVNHFIFLFPLHPAVLKPDFDLPLGQSQGVWYLDSPLAGQVRVEEELLLKLQCLVATVGLSASPPSGSYWQKKDTHMSLSCTQLFDFTLHLILRQSDTFEKSNSE